MTRQREKLREPSLLNEASQPNAGITAKPRMLCATDSSQHSLKVVGRAAAMANQIDAKLTLLHVMSEEEQGNAAHSAPAEFDTIRSTERARRLPTCGRLCVHDFRYCGGGRRGPGGIGLETVEASPGTDRHGFRSACGPGWSSRVDRQTQLTIGVWVSIDRGGAIGGFRQGSARAFIVAAAGE